MLKNRPLTLPLDLKRSKFFLYWNEVYFANNVLYSYKGVTFYIQSKVTPVGISKATEFKTRIIDLLQDEFLIFRDFRSNTRNEIRKIENEIYDFKILFKPSKKDIIDFIEFYNVFAKIKGLRSGNYKKLLLLRDNGALVLSFVKCRNELIAYHVYIITNERVRLLYSATNYSLLNEGLSKEIGKFNRLLHWLDMKEFKHAGVSVYDLGGVGKESISSFKSSFGGIEIIEYNFFVGNTWTSNILSIILNLVNYYGRR